MSVAFLLGRIKMKRSYLQNSSIYLLNLLTLFLCTNIASADEVWRCTSQSGGRCIFAWWLHADVSGGYNLDTTAGPNGGFIQTRGHLFFAVGPLHSGDANLPEWSVNYASLKTKGEEIWHIEAYGMGYQTNSAVCYKVRMDDPSKFRDGCMTYFYRTNGDRRIGYYSSRSSLLGGPIINADYQNSSNSYGICSSTSDAGIVSDLGGKCKMDGSFDSKVGEGTLDLSALPVSVTSELSQICGKDKQEHRKSCDQANEDKEKGICCSFL